MDRPSQKEKPNPGSHEIIHVDEMYGDWFIDYASYVILERAIPHLSDGLKPVQRRILHSMREMEDGRYNKVANIVGNTMKYHPHGDASIGDALIQLGQKDLLIDCQGNWGNILTGDAAAAARYIEARLSKFALEVVFNPKTTVWAASYDGRNREPVTEPVKFPLVLAQGVEGIAVGLSTRILPHNFNELIDASIEALRGRKFEIYPDFVQGGLADVSDYNEGRRGGRVRVRARIERVRKNLLKIHEIPFGTTTTSLIDSIVAANEKGKFKISKVEDNTGREVEILVYLTPGSDPETIEKALFAFTDCEVSLSPNTCVISCEQPVFLGVHEILKRCAEQTRNLLRMELEIRLGELEEKWHFSSLEKIFIENRIYRDIEECETWEAVIQAIAKGLEPHQKRLRRKITTEDIVRLTEIKIKRISKYDSFKADEQIKSLEEEIKEVGKNLRQLTRYAIRYFTDLKKKYGTAKERRTELTSFSKVVAAEVAMANETLFLNRKDGFAGWGLKKDEEVEKCSRMDDLLVIRRDGTMMVTRISEKTFVGPDPAHLSVFQKADETVYQMMYRDGKNGKLMAKRFQIGGVTRDRDYQLTRGTPGTRVFFCQAQGEDQRPAEVMVYLHPSCSARKKIFGFDFNELALKGRGATGNIVTRHPVSRVVKATSRNRATTRENTQAEMDFASEKD